MAVIRERVLIDEKEFVKNYSDIGHVIERDGAEYSEALDLIEFAERKYTETDKLIESEGE